MLKWTHQLEIQVFSHFYSCTFSIERFQTLLRNLTMPILGLTWDPAFLRTRAGMTLALESGVGLLGALVGFVLANGFESFLMWGAFFASGFFLFTHVTNLTQSLESRFPYLVKIVSWNLTLKALAYHSFCPPASGLYGCVVRWIGNHVCLQTHPRFLVSHVGKGQEVLSRIKFYIFFKIWHVLIEIFNPI